MKEYEVFLRLAKEELVLVRKIINDKEIRKELILFHIQQAVEKSMKAILSAKGIIFPKTHDIEDLIEVIKGENIQVPDYVEKFSSLTPYAVEFRYGFLEEEPEKPHQLFGLAEKFFEFALSNVS